MDFKIIKRNNPTPEDLLKDLKMFMQRLVKENYLLRIMSYMGVTVLLQYVVNWAVGNDNE